MSPYADRLRVLPQFHSDEQDKLQNVLFGRLEHRLTHWQPDQVRLELSVRNAAASPSERCSSAGFPANRNSWRPPLGKIPTVQ
jgi:hypothetical protein